MTFTTYTSDPNDRLFATISVSKEGDGYTSQWVVTSQDEVGVQLLAVLNLPVYGYTEQGAVNRVGFIASDVVKFLSSVVGGLGNPNTAGVEDEHVIAHLTHYAPTYAHLTKTERTAVLFEFLTQFNVHAPAVLLAKHEGLSSARTIHDRLAQARKQGLIN